MKSSFVIEYAVCKTVTRSYLEQLLNNFIQSSYPLAERVRWPRQVLPPQGMDVAKGGPGTPQSNPTKNY